ncbi:MAG TPA: acyltransferase family protein [Bacillus sp. (in: firmicutes)]|uniref:acyltransferase family protein n=1 Tax=Bacillus litorisediminis TaxID=2922713 RepID=UPI001FACE41E|nr:acyltransferase family protein [Bacillus litorisediminis]HWO74914.1 acyltransferase family protein [Bacillus sp. (in: firmicutes)]
MTRHAFFDNAKFILIFLVVFGHLIQSYIEDFYMVSILYKVIYTFHMPAFILISGFFAKGFKEPGYIKKLSMKLLLPYFIFQLLYSVYYYFLLDRSTLVTDPFNPQWSLWFLISLFFWNLMLFLYTKWKPLVALTIACGVALLVGYVDWIGNYLSLSRTFVFFPFFLLGYYMDKRHFEKCWSWKPRIAALMIMITVTAFFIIFPDLNEKWLLGSKAYVELGAFGLEGMLNRLFLFGISLIMCYSFFSFVPTGKTFFTNLGRNTLYVYLLHGFFVRTFRVSEIKDEVQTVENLVWIILISIFLTWFLSTKIVTAIFQPFIELKIRRFKEFMVTGKEKIIFFITPKHPHSKNKDL